MNCGVLLLPPWAHEAEVKVVRDGRNTMNRRQFTAGLLGVAGLGRPAFGQVPQIVLGKQYGLPFLPQMVMEAQRLVEKHAAERGIDKIEVVWQTMGGPGALN